MELIRHAKSASDKKKSIFVLLWSYLALAVFLTIYSISISKYRSVHSQEISQVIYQPYSMQPTNKENPTYSPPPPPASTTEKLPLVVDSIKEMPTDTLYEEDDNKQNNNTGNENSINGNGIDGNGEGDGDPNGIFLIAEKMPSFPGGDLAMRSFIAGKVIYPREARKSGLEGIVYIKFCVTSTGSIQQVSIAKGIDPLLDEEAIRVVESMPNWIPGEQHGRKVSVWFTISINFQLK